MTQLRLASVNLKIVARNTKSCSVRHRTSLGSSSRGLSAFAQKADRLSGLNPDAAAVIERLVDDVLDDLEGRRP